MRRRGFLRGAAVAGTGAAALARVPGVSALTLEDFTRDVRCPCGCGERLNRCSSPKARQGKAFIRQKISDGWSRGRIIDAYVKRFTGPDNSDYELRVTVSKSGRGLFLWLFPPVSVAVFSAALYAFVRRRSGSGTVAAGTAATVECGCGTDVPRGAEFCPSCGDEVRAETCGDCGTLLPAGTAFCTGCGAPSASSCSSCGDAARPGASFCSSCGDSL